MFRLNTVMLIDDDVPMLEYVSLLLKGLELNLEQVASAFSSEQALELFRSTLPDLVITDIGMPGMDGLELARAFRQLKPDVRLIFLTCYEDFHYSKQAFQLEADDYLIKDELSEAQLEVSIRKSLKQLKGRAESLEQHSFRKDIERNKDLLKQTFLKELLQGGSNLGETVRFGERLGIVWKAANYRLAQIHIDTGSITENYRYQDFGLIYYALYNIAEELSLEYPSITPLLLQDYRIYLIWNGEMEPQGKAAEALLGYMRALSEKAELFLKVETVGFYAAESSNLEGLSKEYLSMAAVREHTFYRSERETRLAPQASQWNHPEDGRFDKERGMLILALEENNAAWIDMAINNLMQHAASEQHFPKIVLETCADFVRHLAYESGVPAEAEFYIHIQKTVRMSEASTLTKRQLKRLLLQSATVERAVTTKDPKLQSIDRFLEEHVDEMVTSIDMAEHLHLNPSYFSRYFKKLAGVNFTEYVNQYKMNMAIRMLQKQNETVENVAYMLGFSDRAYFSKVFKKYSGKSPSEYKGIRD
ncbi:MAG: response regulator [Gorillibacterium sp.]|nr:response regulator [Gorillibacterium sp.]